ncbi:MAG: VCBS repeat-containing protein, partial [Algicola sp.]|nr:VCBS repeat-containing protein [Algicola sp.]
MKYLQQTLLCLLLLMSSTYGLAAIDTTKIVGSTSGKFDVGSNGNALYRIPIKVTPGTAKVEPNLALAYNSQGGNGLTGVGWKLQGLSSIHRCPTNLTDDGYIDGVDFDDNDQFCLDGQRLVAISGVYGASLTEYRTQNESFKRIHSYGTAGNGPMFFLVTNKLGHMLQYGVSDDSRVEVQGQADVMLWKLNKTEDRFGNFQTISYYEDNAIGESYPLRIDYTGNYATGLTAYNSVQFSYETRSDDTRVYRAGASVKNTQRLTRIGIYNGSQVAREYQLAYEATDTIKSSRLASITECGSDGSCLNPTTFEWGVDSHSTGSRSLYTTTNWGGSNTTFTGDFNGDGLVDIASGSGSSMYMRLFDGYYFDSETWLVANNWSGSGHNWSGDFNGDGLTDIASGYGGSVYMKLANGNGFDSQTWAVASSWGGSGYSWVGDFNGDGLSDIASGKLGIVYMKLANGIGFDSQTWTVADQWGGSSYTWVADFNGDGLSDIASAKG